MSDTNDDWRAFGDQIAKAVEDTGFEGKTFGKYRFEAEIGSGGMGTAYLAKDVTLGRQVVIKLVKFQSEDPHYRSMMAARFRREAQAACRVLHPNVAVTFAFDEIDGRHLLVMEYVEGRTLRDELMTEFGRPRPLPPKRAVKIAIGILDGLAAIHAAKIVHRDLKPGNVMLTRKGGQVKILDFGLGKASDAFGDPALDMTLTQQGTPVGSPMYMSPEQIRSLPIDERTDIYSMGVVLFQMLIGKVPFSGKPMDIYDQHRDAPVPPMIVPDAKIPAALQAVVRKAMAKAPGDRFASASEMRAALLAIDFDAKPVVPIKIGKRKRRSRMAPFAAVALMIAAAVGAAALTTRTVSRRAPETVAKTVQEKPDVPVKGVEPAKADDGIQIPPPPPAARATVAQGCELYATGRTSDAIVALTGALASEPNDAEGLYCLCGAYVRQPDSRAEAKKACKAYLAHRGRDSTKSRQADLWLRRIKD